MCTSARCTPLSLASSLYVSCVAATNALSIHVQTEAFALLDSLDRQISAAPTLISLRVFHDFRAPIAGISTFTVLANNPILRFSVLLTVTIRLQWASPPLKVRAVIGFAVLVVLVGVDQFVADGSAELFPAVFFVCVPRKTPI